MEYFYEWHWETIYNLHIGEDGLELWNTEDFDFADSLSELFGKRVNVKEIVGAINNDTHRITIQKWKDDGDDLFTLLDYANVQKDGTIIIPKDFGRLPKKYRIELEQFLKGDV
mgnify:FL=1|tara:strand:+ start:426 stop:764 length:339 start_codon:yes stop_codon:yes gene_type:complete